MKASDKRAGTTVACPRCGLELVVPESPIPVGQAVIPPAPFDPSFDPDPVVTIDTRPLTDRPRSRRTRNDFPVVTLASVAVAAVLVIALVLVVNGERSDRGAGADFVAAIPGVVLLVAILAGGLFLYLVPSFIAFRRGHPNAAAIAALNILLGWAFVGWVAALVWSLTEVRSRDHYHFHNGPG